jgi:hypothetical protein
MEQYTSARIQHPNEEGRQHLCAVLEREVVRIFREPLELLGSE